jgi:hypothetical protein
MNMRVGGSLLYPVAPNVPNDELIYRPEYGGGGLLNSGKNFYDPGNVGATFAGGSLLGQYYDASTNTFKPLQPSGVYTSDPAQAGDVDDTNTGGGAFTLSELMDFQAALGQANFGERPVQSIFSQFEDMGDGTYDIRRPKEGSPVPYSGIFQGALYGTDADGNMVPMNLAVYGPRHGRAGEILDRDMRNRLIRNRLMQIDESGGQDGGPGQGGTDGPDDGDDGNDGGPSGHGGGAG